MKKITIISIIVVIGLIFTSCNTGVFLASDFSQKAKLHKKIAVIPVQTVLSGKQPSKLTEAQIAEIEEAEGRAFQTSLYNCLLAKCGSKKRDIKIEIQTIDKTNGILKDSNISIRDAWDKNPEKLAAILGVDAVVKTKVEKTRYMSDLASYGVSLGADVLNVLTDGAAWYLVPGGVSKTNDINAECNLLNGSDGSLLWRIAVQTATDWTMPANQIIDNLNHRFARKFPYRKK
jgi:hypothetical protein